jgi:uncharacterized sporulation protein YeaH/YhbH (DUF444 family)
MERTTMGKSTISKQQQQQQPKHEPLAAQLKQDVAGNFRVSGGREKQKRKTQAQEDSVVDADLTEKILRLAREQQKEEKGAGDLAARPLAARQEVAAPSDASESDEGSEQGEDYYEELVRATEASDLFFTRMLAAGN